MIFHCTFSISNLTLDPNWFSHTYLFFQESHLCYVWFLENLKDNARERRYKEKVKGK